MNSSQQFIGTPSPWHYQEHSDAYTHIVRGPQDQFVAQLCQDTTGRAETDARLIAAAPELLAFTQWAESRQPEMLKTIETNKFVFNDIGDEPGNWQHLAFTLYTELCALNEMARSVIAKATKGTP